MYLLSRHSFNFKFCLSLACLLGFSTAASAQQENAEDEALEIEEWLVASMCAEGNRLIDLNHPISFSYTDSAGNNPRHLTVAQSGLTTADLSNLELAWAIAFPATSGMRAAPVIIGDTIFYSATDSGRVFALDIASGCAKWVYESGTRLRSSIAYDVIDGQGMLVFSDMPGMIHAVNAENGESIWINSGQAENNQGMLTGTPVIHEDRVIVPVSGSGVITGGNPNYECCENHGAVTALNILTGETLWDYPVSYTHLRAHET